jgi:hypothetical protein
VTGLSASSPLRVREASAQALAFGIYPPGLWTDVPRQVRAQLAQILAQSSRALPIAACLAALLRLGADPGDARALAERLVDLLGNHDALDADAHELCRLALFPGARLGDLACGLLRALTAIASPGNQAARTGATARQGRGADAVAAFAVRADGADRVAMCLGLIENLCFENRAGAADLAAAGVLPLLVRRMDGEHRLGALRALTNITNECPRAVHEAVACQVLPAAVACLDVCAKRVEQGGGDVSLDFDACLMLLGLLANVAEQATGLAAFAASPRDVAFVASLFLRTLPARALAELESGDTGSTIEFGWTPEDLVLSAHVCLVLGVLAADAGLRARVASALPGRRGFSPVLQTLQAFVEFQRQAGVLTPQTEAAIRRVGDNLTAGHAALMLPPDAKRPAGRQTKAVAKSKA